MRAELKASDISKETSKESKQKGNSYSSNKILKSAIAEADRQLAAQLPMALSNQPSTKDTRDDEEARADENTKDGDNHNEPIAWANLPRDVDLPTDSCEEGDLESTLALRISFSLKYRDGGKEEKRREEKRREEEKKII